MPEGTVLWFNDISGTGTIVADLDGAFVMVAHKSIVGQGYKILDEGQRVSFVAEKCKAGLKACLVIPLEC